ncbi:O-methyltransferase [Wenyingzhuangia sp. 2_MG-2023]|uniref:O-methyltransferase n=1 Tax=Wenyingzhuangia sp. 2_MG-2023 TaxID=3062639 RepID=UPI0026E478EF|nr:class I SAM-dependent methyltransferase [Wenyingzhuangia sp. 2_MG-2023]MDO6737343.1 class I SAM-dependent methyltransferase [Wenyingzhuangia sp. 2_MG-2023]
MIIEQQKKLTAITHALYEDAKYDKLKMIKGAAKSFFKSFKPENFEEAYLAISKEQGEDLVQIIKENNLKNIVEFGTSFGISTLFLAQGILETNGHIITTELLESKAKIAIENFRKAGVENHIDVRIGDALETLKSHSNHIDLLLLDGWMDLYHPLFQILEPNFNNNTIIYVDNANAVDSQKFLTSVSTEKYQIESKFNGKTAIIKIKQ